MRRIILIFQYTAAEYAKAARQYLRASRAIKISDIIIAALLLSVIVTFLFLASFTATAILILIIAAAVILFGIILYLVFPYITFKKTSKYHEEYTLTFTDQGIKFETSKIDSEIPWNKYKNLWESQDFYFLVQAPRQYSIVPKRAFQNKSEQALFEEIALENIITYKRVIR